ncbi:uncharacterized protein M6B38_390425 [Iris pallida]|uniref:Uncharacterized protein n=1 Tax=Iris pallida TaxID=29817 RepID=A0AAX6G091_IRIPA|nr:uncharacterized protein M6B38_390425 [Iris pallida]
MSFGNSAGGGRPTPPLPPPPARSSSSTLSPLAPPFTVNPNLVRVDSSALEFLPVGFSSCSAGGLADQPGLAPDPSGVSPNPHSDHAQSFPHGGAFEGFRAYPYDSNLWQGEPVSSSKGKLHYGSECTDWLQPEIPEFVTNNYPYSISEGATGIPTSAYRCEPVRCVPLLPLSEALPVKDACNPFGSDTMYTFSKRGATAQYNNSESSVRVSSSLHKGMSYSHVLNPFSTESCKTFDSESSYDRYIAELDSSRTDPTAYYYPATTISTSFQQTAPSASGTGSYMGINMLKDTYFAFDNPYSINAEFVDSLPVKEFRMNKNFEAKESHKNFEVKEGCASFQRTATSATGTNSHMGIGVLKDKSFTFEDQYSFNTDYVDRLPVKEATANKKLEAKEGCRSFQLTASSASGTSSYMGIGMVKDKSFTFEDPHSISSDYVDYIPVNESRANQGFEASSDEISRMRNAEKSSGISMDYFSSGHESAMRKSMIQSREANSGLKIKHLDLPNAFTTYCGLAEPADGPSQDSSGTLDQTVDSPCWKGASVSQQSPFSSLDPGFCQSVEVESKRCNNQKQIPVGAGYSESLSFELFTDLICKEQTEDSLIYNLQQSSSLLPTTRKICGDTCKRPSDCGEEIQHSGIHKEQSIEERSDKEREPDGNDIDVAALNQEIVISSNQSIPTAGIANHKTSYKGAVQGSLSECQPLTTHLATPSDNAEPLASSLVMVKDAPLTVILGQLQYLSEMLASSDNFAANELTDHDCELLRLIIDNLGEFAIKNKKDFSKGSFPDSEPKAAQLKMNGLKGNDIMNQNINISHDTNGSVHSVRSGINNNELDNLAFDCGASYVNKDHDVVQAFQTIQEKSYYEQEEKVQSAVYKKLWIDAEAALCSMKYELQVAQMKTDTVKNNHQIEGYSQQVPLLPLLKPVYNEHEPPKPKQIKPLEALHSDEEIDPSVMARINVLIGRQDRPSSENGGIDPSVMARLNVLKRRDDVTSSLSPEHQQKMSTPQTDMWLTEDSMYTMGGAEGKTAALENNDDGLLGSAAAKDVQPSTLSGMGFQSHTSSGPARQILSGSQGNSSSSSEWEHVIREDLN